MSEGRIRTSAAFCTTGVGRRRTQLYPGARTRDPATPALFFGGKNCTLQKDGGAQGCGGGTRLASMFFLCVSMHIQRVSTSLHIAKISLSLLKHQKRPPIPMSGYRLAKFDNKLNDITRSCGVLAGQ